MHDHGMSTLINTILNESHVVYIYTRTHTIWLGIHAKSTLLCVLDSVDFWYRRTQCKENFRSGKEPKKKGIPTDPWSIAMHRSGKALRHSIHINSRNFLIGNKQRMLCLDCIGIPPLLVSSTSHQCPNQTLSFAHPAGTIRNTNQEGKRGSKNCIGIPVIPFYMRWVVFFRYFKWAMWNLGISNSRHFRIKTNQVHLPYHIMGQKSLAFSRFRVRIPSSILDALSFPCSGVLTRPKAMSCKWLKPMVFEGSTLGIDVVSPACCIQCLLISLQLQDFQK